MAKLSFSSIKMFSECGQKYDYHYNHKIRSKWFHTALAFGSAVDEALNDLLLNKDLEKAIGIFDKKWAFQYVNGKYTDLALSPSIVSSDSDFDADLLTDEDKIKLTDYFKKDWDIVFGELVDKKKQLGWKQFTDKERSDYNYVVWHSLRRKGLIMLASYEKKILPRIMKVIAVQHSATLENDEGDIVQQYLDLVVQWEDGSILLLDNKTSARDYEEDSAGRSPQLISYYHKAKEQFGVEAVGFIVMHKNIQKNKTKLCHKCGFDGTESRSKTCPQEFPGLVIKRGKEVEGMIRCDGEWKVTINPECYMQVVINRVTEAAEDLVLSTFDDASEGIKKGHYYKNLSQCKQGSIICPYYAKCWTGSDEDLVLIDSEKRN